MPLKAAGVNGHAAAEGAPRGSSLPHMAQHPQLWHCFMPELKARLQFATIQTKCQVHFFVRAPCNSCVCLQKGLALFHPEVIQGINWHKQVREWKAQTARVLTCSAENPS